MGRWVPPSLRNRVGTGDTMDMKKREENSVRVTNLSEDTREEDLRVLSCPYYSVRSFSRLQGRAAFSDE